MTCYEEYIWLFRIQIRQTGTREMLEDKKANVLRQVERIKTVYILQYKMWEVHTKFRLYVFDAYLCLFFITNYMLDSIYNTYLVNSSTITVG